MQHPSLMAELVHERHADLYRDAAASRRAAEGRPDGDLPHDRTRGGHRPARERLGLVLLAWGSRLAPVSVNDKPC